MNTTKLYIKNMVCDRCKRVVREDLEKLGYSVNSVELGEAEITSGNEIDLDKIEKQLEESGFALLNDAKTTLVEKIKTNIIQLINHQEIADLHINTSDWLSQKTGTDYHTLSTLFSGLEGITIEKYLILQRIEKVKELLVYNELSLKEIAFKLGYSSVAHLSNQFKKITGLTTTHFKQIKEAKRKTIDHLTD